MIAVIGAQDGIVGRDAEPMRALEDAFTPRSQEIAIGIEYRDGVFATAEDIDPVRPVHGHRGDLVEIPAVGQFGPIGDEAIREVSGPQDELLIRHH